jgi:hypothetical protein
MKSRNPRKSLAETTVKPCFCNVSLKLAMLANQDTYEYQTYPAKLAKTMIIITSAAVNFLDMFLRGRQNDLFNRSSAPMN